jgi:hypothetical protein
MKIKTSIAASVILFLSPLASADTWIPIIGIPAPLFGIVEEPTALPTPWTAEVPGFYYVCSSCAGSSSTAFGTPSSPKNNIPNSLSNGDVVVLAGDFRGGNFTFSCSADAPCFLLGDPTNPPTMTGETSFGGSYLVVDGVHVTLPSNAYGASLVLRGSFNSFRNGRVTGTLSSGGAVAEGDFLVLYNNQITDNGDVNALNDQDRHGLKVVGTNIWVIGNTFTRNSGDGVQVGGTGTRNSVRYIYIGRNVAHENKQTGFWVKEAEHVIISQNIAYNHRPSGSSSGEGFGGQYDGANLWFLFNESYNNAGGIGFKSSNNGGGNDFYVVGNYIHDITASGFDANDSWSISSISSWNGADITIVNNTIDNTTGGIHLNGRTGSAYIYNNTIKRLQNSNAQPIFAADPNDIQFEGANATDGLEVIDTGMAPLPAKDPYAIFQSRYGKSILFDFEGLGRPIGQWDIGAFEAQGASGPRPEAPVLTIQN